MQATPYSNLPREVQYKGRIGMFPSGMEFRDPPPRPKEEQFARFKDYALQENTIHFTPLGIPLLPDGSLPFDMPPIAGFNLLQKTIALLGPMNFTDYDSATLAERAITTLIAITHSNTQLAFNEGIPDTTLAPLIFDMALALAALWELRSKLSPTNGTQPNIQHCTLTALQAWNAVKYPVKLFMTLTPKWAGILRPGHTIDHKVFDIFGVPWRTYEVRDPRFVPNVKAYSILKALYFVVNGIERAREHTIRTPDWFSAEGCAIAQEEYIMECEEQAHSSRAYPSVSTSSGDPMTDQRAADVSPRPSPTNLPKAFVPSTEANMKEAMEDFLTYLTSDKPNNPNTTPLPKPARHDMHGFVISERTATDRLFATEREQTRIDRGQKSGYVHNLPPWAPAAQIPTQESQFPSTQTYYNSPMRDSFPPTRINTPDIDSFPSTMPDSPRAKPGPTLDQAQEPVQAMRESIWGGRDS